MQPETEDESSGNKGHPDDGEPLFLFVFATKIQIKILEIGRF
jgi:hypothetical protein